VEYQLVNNYKKNIDYSNNEYEKRQRYEKFRAIYESKEAIEKGK